MSDPISLDELFGQASKWLRQQRAEEAKPKTFRVKDKDPSIQPAAFYANPENWKRTHGVALLHEETQTILGNFSEYQHLHEPATKKLVRETAPMSVTEIRKVSGEWYLERIAEVPAKREDYHVQRTVILDVALGELKMHSPLVELQVYLHAGAVDRVELALDTVFAADTGEQECFLTIPAGTNIREITSRECKIALKRALGEE